MQTSERIVDRARARLDWIVGAAIFLLTFLIYFRTLAPTVAYLFDDSLEFQLLAARMAIAHPTGYPLYSLLIKLATFLPIGDVAYRVNLVSAFFGALTIPFVYLAARLLTARFMTANDVSGELLVRAPAFIAALVFAFGETFWSQAVVAEVYTLQALLTAVMLWLALRWSAASENVAALHAKPSLIPLAFWAGLMLTHHRMSVLILPALAVYVLSYDRSFLRQPRTLLKLALVFILPLLLYAYLPIRGMVTSSLDGGYQNTPQGFLNWILGTAYTVFLTQNPLSQERDAAYYLNLFVSEFTPIGLLAAAAGFVALFLRAWREWMLLVLGLVLNLIFALTYRVADVNVFFIPSFLFVALLIAAGLSGLLWLAFYAWTNRLATSVAAVAWLALLFLPFTLYGAHHERVNLSNRTDIAEYGRAMLSQPLPNNATLIGILGEMTLVRYFQETQSLRPDVETIAADKEDARLKAIEDALKRQRTVFLTRPLKDVEKKYSLSSIGPLIQVLAKPNKKDAPAPHQVLNADFGDVKLVGYDHAEVLDGARDALAQRLIPVTLYWQPQKKIPNNRLVSLKLLDEKGQLAGQLDRQPVLDAYPTSAWRNGEYIADAYDVPIFVGAAPGDYMLQVTMYNPENGEVYGQRDLERVHVSAQTQTVPSDLLGVDRLAFRNLGELELVGYTLDTSEPFQPGTTIPLTLLWRAPQPGAMSIVNVALTDTLGKLLETNSNTVGGQDTEAGQYVRQELNLSLPNNLTTGSYLVQLKASGGMSFVPASMTLGTLEVKAP
ncbi:MAG TPA: DUF2723 domain-containing protein [Anaerolineae bacterium]|nr:DUF2723 domain-containing protein [Anaerolineae bacterium]